MQRENSNKKIIKVGEISEHQWGTVANRGGVRSYHSNDKLENADSRFKKVSKEMIIVGGVGNTDSQNRDRGRVFKSGCCPAIVSRDYKDAIKVVRVWERK